MVVGKPSHEARGVGRLDRRAIGLDVGLDLGVGVAGDTDHPDAGRPGPLERLQIGGGIPERRVRALNRPGHHLAGRQVEMRALEAGETLLLEHLHHRLQRLAPDHAAVLCVGVEAEPLHHVGGGPAPRAELAAPVAEDVEGGDALRHHERIVAGHQDHREAEPDLARALGQRGQEHLGAGGMADLGKEMLLGEPEIREAGVLGRGHVIEVLPVDCPLALRGPGLRDLELTHESEFHLATLPVARERRGMAHCGIRSVDLHDHVQVLVDGDARVGSGDDGRLALLDDGGAGELGARGERVAVVDRAGGEAVLDGLGVRDDLGPFVQQSPAAGPVRKETSASTTWTPAKPSTMAAFLRWTAPTTRPC